METNQPKGEWQQMWGSMHNLIGKYCPIWGSLPFHPIVLYTFPHTPNTKNTQTPYNPVSMVPSLVSTHFYSCSLTFSLRSDEEASVWRQKKLSFNKLIYCFVSAPKRYHIMATNKVSYLYSYVNLALFVDMLIIHSHRVNQSCHDAFRWANRRPATSND